MSMQRSVESLMPAAVILRHQLFTLGRNPWVSYEYFRPWIKALGFSTLQKSRTSRVKMFKKKPTVGWPACVLEKCARRSRLNRLLLCDHRIEGEPQKLLSRILVFKSLIMMVMMPRRKQPRLQDTLLWEILFFQNLLSLLASQRLMGPSWSLYRGQYT